jgi:hypothetical protein
MPASSNRNVYYNAMVRLYLSSFLKLTSNSLLNYVPPPQVSFPPTPPPIDSLRKAPFKSK